MHHALKIYDIIYAILQHLESSTTDLVNVAMTCSKFSDPALNILWREQSSLAPLIMCLPQDTSEAPHDDTIIFSREPLLTEWERVRINASRIRRLVSNFNHSRVKAPRVPSGPVLQQLFALFPPARLFPNLFALHFGAVSDLPEFRANFLLLRQFFLLGLETLALNVPVDVRLR
ncbi:hypothetical protein CY34DRAFT_12482 [Suillus luteus UH-Slu-Lm8-n1]|uniref:F-box domain-containing protein n=1 Tax=Suillus luteus UH-Slu-Lm8-n1 TaxID=930992 RepID=A0A0D0AK90_9AGAM|nr:hypothetical protein CY34DRAFT_12482 [Suillus luteus UH-Slu-Lm8-n1]